VGTDALGNAAALQALLNANTNWDDDGFVGTRVVVWEIDANNVGVALVTAPQTVGGDDVTVTQIATLVGFADQAAVDAFTSALVAGNFGFGGP
jgi:hypothetical protein